ncbi:type II toxin-antitoxin system RelE/ParE family toxin [Tannockella kyphosi]|uniref:type II toxin-antitoxin system RelE/ParE family toxin n=1 Tax=Tannockella kyphosi TaxID=2899121 RepID=UPI0037D9BCF3
MYAPKAALDLLDNIDKTIDNLKTFPLAYPVNETTKPLDFEYRMIPVKNYLIFYVVTGDIVEIHRVVYSKMDLTRLLK